MTTANWIIQIISHGVGPIQAQGTLSNFLKRFHLYSVEIKTSGTHFMKLTHTHTHLVTSHTYLVTSWWHLLGDAWWRHLADKIYFWKALLFRYSVFDDVKAHLERRWRYFMLYFNKIKVHYSVKKISMACADEWLMNLAQILAQQGRFLIFFFENSEIFQNFSKIFYSSPHSSTSWSMTWLPNQQTNEKEYN